MPHTLRSARPTAAPCRLRRLPRWGVLLALVLAPLGACATEPLAPGHHAPALPPRNASADLAPAADSGAAPTPVARDSTGTSGGPCGGTLGWTCK